ncbi:nitrogen regulation protein NR(II) [Oxalobacter vibrioformis]|uniref:Sensory histidine kinase/phosphatase NtrB n=1 Tax=Oxalobacter vibrioformis TaxID=933080 RepID=A0A9E9LZU5_9BURK|nr:nitrogen regulation protein NR(II) [Oxalobacter vibrioformis]NLC23310.1 PAS domain-containing protein [Oxalobacter sp.]WAW10569.1 nitrogen regulation protein NR(II) [Oxalobacter vibrioformis]
MNTLKGLDLLATAILILDQYGRLSYVNPAAEDMLEASAKVLLGQELEAVFTHSGELEAICCQIRQRDIVEKRQELILERSGRVPLHVHCIASAVDSPDNAILIELRENVQQLRLDREERLIDQSQANRELIRNLAHEIKNPLGGIRGAAQLLEMELPKRDLQVFREYTQVIIRESERLQALVDRLLVPHRRGPVMEDINVHEICERVRSLILAEFPEGLIIRRDYDLSIPEFAGDKEQLIQAVLNVTKNAAIALADRIMNGDAEIVFKTRIARQITIAKVRYRLALTLHVIDNGPGISPDMMERIFYPLVSGHEGGSGMGLTLAQTYIQQHRGMIECDSWQGHTEFLIRIPLW